MSRVHLEAAKKSLSSAKEKLKEGKFAADHAGDKAGSKDIEEAIEHVEKVEKKFGRKM